MLYQALQSVVESFGQRPALIAGGETLTYDDLWRHSTALAKALREERYIGVMRYRYI